MSELTKSAKARKIQTNVIDQHNTPEEILAGIYRFRECFLTRPGRLFRHRVQVRHIVMRRRAGHAITPNKLEFPVRHNVIFETKVRQRPARPALDLRSFSRTLLSYSRKISPSTSVLSWGRKLLIS